MPHRETTKPLVFFFLVLPYGICCGIRAVLADTTVALRETLTPRGVDLVQNKEGDDHKHGR